MATRLPAALVPTLVILGACANLEHRLRPEREISELATLASLTDEAQGRVDRVESQLSETDRVTIAIEEIGSGTCSRALVLIHGVISDRRMWRYLAGELTSDCDLLLIDLPGCGDSDCPDGDSADDLTYSPDWMAAHVLGALHAHLGSREVDLTLVGHSLGGGVILRMLGNIDLRSRYADVVDRVDGAVLMAPLDFGIAQANPAFVEIASLSGIELAMGTLLGILRREVARGIVEGCVDPDTMPWEEFDRTYEILSDPQRFRAAQWILRRAAPFDDDGKPVWPRAEQLVADYDNIDVPCLLLWGSRDETLPVASGYKLCAQLRNARLRVLRACKHCLPSEEPWYCIEWIRRFLDDAIDHSSPIVELCHLPGEALWGPGDLQQQLSKVGTPVAASAASGS